MSIDLKILHQRVCLGAIALMVTVPFLMAHHYNPIRTFFQEWVAAALSLVALTSLFQRKGDEPLELPEIALLPVGLMLIGVLQWLFVPDVLTDRLLLFNCYMVWTVLIVILGRHLARTVGLQALVTVMATAILIGAMLEALSGAIQLAGHARLPLVFPALGGGLRGNLAQTNNFADYLWLGIASAVYLRSRNEIGNISTACSLLILVPFGVLSGSRSIWLYGVALAALSATWKTNPAQGEGRKALWIWGLTPLIGSLLFQLAWTSGWFPHQGDIATSGIRIADSSYSPVRLTLWRMALDALMGSPWLGTGFGQYTRYFHLHVLELMPYRLPGLPEHAHNMLLNLLAEMGSGAGLLLLILGVRWAVGLTRLPRSPDIWWIAAITLVLGIHSNLEYPLWYGFFLSIAALLLGAGSHTNYRLHLGRTAPYAMAAIIGLGATTLLNLYQHYSLLEDTLNGRIGGDTEEDRKKNADQALLRLARESMLRPYVDLAVANIMTEAPDGLDAKLLTCDRAQRFSASREIVFKCAHLLSLAEKDEESKLALRRAVAAYPDSAEAVLRQWKQSGTQDPAIARLLANFPPIATTELRN